MQLSAQKTAVVTNLVNLFNSISSSGDAASVAFQAAYDAFLDDESFTFEECESICMQYGWA